MKRRFLAAAALASLPSAWRAARVPPRHWAPMTPRCIINGKATNALQPVTCYQTGRSWTIETLDKEPGLHGDGPAG